MCVFCEFIVETPILVKLPKFNESPSIRVIDFHLFQIPFGISSSSTQLLISGSGTAIGIQPPFGVSILFWVGWHRHASLWVYNSVEGIYAFKLSLNPCMKNVDVKHHALAGVAGVCRYTVDQPRTMGVWSSSRRDFARGLK
jgi:hypothetical protein